ncbi:hypothetical protein KUTeg_003246 [Tegillarca granosa]|uniref:Regulatory protein SIR2 homolog 7 n=1 Tax=Tegillarca granosa TaxID=220873 RepID=A0ABQ9FLL1_TEGGR|nr:hypothetical protein KUTeg_003246 [Tegillarca granosa]
MHVRSGLPRNVLSEVHGNMYLEICTNCKPQRDYIRLFDVTEKTGVRRHYTDRNCHMCGKKLRDTIVHFGEKGGLKSPYRWKQAAKAANDCDIILCLGTSLKILKKYSCLWCMDRRLKQRPDLYIVNLQWTPKDEVATLKINGRCDAVLKRVMEILEISIPVYRREEDAIFTMAVSLKPSEYKTTSKKILAAPKHVRKRKRKKVSTSDYEQCEEKKPFDSSMTDDNSHFKSEDTNKKIDEQRNGISRGLNGLMAQSSLSTSHIPLQTSPLDLSVSTQSQLSSNFARNWSHDLFSIFLANQNLLLASQQQLDVCTTCLANGRLGQQCTCVNSGLSLPTGLMVPDINSLLSYQSMQLMRDMFLGNSSMHLPFPGFLPYPLSPSVFQSPQKVETVLRDHCYLNKQQMQQLSPKQNKDKNSSKSSKLVNSSGQSQKVKVETATSPLKPGSSYIKESDLTLETDDNTQKLRTMCKLERSISQDDRPPEVFPQSKSEESNETEPESSNSKKPKLTRSVSVPGWFGKGLNIRKKKRF